MNRTEFLKGHGLTCKNWRWSWSWVNEEDRLVVFGASSKHEVGEYQTILRNEWQTNNRGRRIPGYAQAIEHLKLAYDSGFRFFTFRQVESAPNETTGSVRILSFEAELEERKPIKGEHGWIGVPIGDFEDYSGSFENRKKYYLEGSRVPVSSWRIERSVEARRICLDHYGYSCQVCGLDFESEYGDLGRGYIHVHHLEPISLKESEHEVDPVNDLRPVCPNCHAMIHRNGVTRSLDEVWTALSQAANERQ